MKASSAVKTVSSLNWAMWTRKQYAILWCWIRLQLRVHIYGWWKWPYSFFLALYCFFFSLFPFHSGRLCCMFDVRTCTMALLNDNCGIDTAQEMYNYGQNVSGEWPCTWRIETNYRNDDDQREKEWRTWSSNGSILSVCIDWYSDAWWYNGLFNKWNYDTNDRAYLL